MAAPRTQSNIFQNPRTARRMELRCFRLQRGKKHYTSLPERHGSTPHEHEASSSRARRLNTRPRSAKPRPAPRERVARVQIVLLLPRVKPIGRTYSLASPACRTRTCVGTNRKEASVPYHTYAMPFLTSCTGPEARSCCLLTATILIVCSSLFLPLALRR